ncbi:putative 60S ribosomal protein L13a-4-like [Capsicum annuum]|nr:putative 60S ribosomal protein L13a-4-like [Capsicum annuum]
MYGFGYDKVYDDYKVVGIFCIFGSGGSYDVEVKMYSLKSDSWRNVYDYQGGVLLNDSGKFVKGKLHWSTTARCAQYTGWEIISIDLTDEKWGKVEQPCFEEGNLDFALGVLENNLSVLCNYRTWADVWVMKEYGVKDSWGKMYTIRCPNDDPGKFMFSPPLCVSNKAEDLPETAFSTLYPPQTPLCGTPLASLLHIPVKSLRNIPLPSNLRLHCRHWVKNGHSKNKCSVVSIPSPQRGINHPHCNPEDWSNRTIRHFFYIHLIEPLAQRFSAFQAIFQTYLDIAASFDFTYFVIQKRLRSLICAPVPRPQGFSSVYFPIPRKVPANSSNTFDFENLFRQDEDGRPITVNT